MITRTINIDLKVEIACCRDGIEIFRPKERTFQKTIVSNRIRFDENLIIWRDRAISIAEEYLSGLAEDECRRGVSAVLCKFIVDSTGTSVDEKVTVEIPADIRANIVVLLERIRDNLDNIDYVENDLIPGLDKYLSEKGLTRGDIRDIIAEVGLENVIK
jgi:hypothetical protein